MYVAHNKLSSLLYTPCNPTWAVSVGSAQYPALAPTTAAPASMQLPGHISIVQLNSDKRQLLQQPQKHQEKARKTSRYNVEMPMHQGNAV